MQKKLVMVSAALFAAVFLTAAAPQPAAPAAPKPVAAMTAPSMAPAAPAAMQPTMAPVVATPAKAAAPATVKPAPKQDKLGSVIGGGLLQILIVFMTIAIPIVLTPVVAYLLRKMKVTNLQTQQMVDGIVDQGVVHGLNYANEQAHKLGDNPVKGAEKLAMARDKALAYIKDSGIANKGAEYIEDLIEAKLGGTRPDPESTSEAPDEDKPDEEPVAGDKPAADE